MKILYVENHGIFAQQVTRLFLSVHQLTVVANLAEARNGLSKERFDLLLIDYDLEDGKGTELVKEVRKQNLAMLVIGVSAHNKGNQALLEAGANAVCSKMEFNHISEVIQRVQALN